MSSSAVPTIAKMKSAFAFRSRFELPGSANVQQWFPQHMHVGMRVMQAKLRSIDCVIEVHDARIPLSGRNPQFFKQLYAIKPHVLVLNKADLVEFGCRKKFEEVLRDKLGVKNILWTQCNNLAKSTALSQLMRTIVSEVECVPRFHRTEVSEYSLMVVGIPNTGKSSLINALRGLNLRKPKAAQEGARPGVTRSVQERIKVHESPPVYLLDTPGIVAPYLSDVEAAMKMALCQTVLEHTLGVRYVADYLLYWCNKNERFDYVQHCGLKAPSDNIMEVLINAAVYWNIRSRVRTLDGQEVLRPDVDSAANRFVNLFRSLALGKLALDLDVIHKF